MGTCDANTSDEGGDHHNVVLSEHLAEARAQGNAAANQSAFAEVGLRFRPCFSAPVTLAMRDIDIVGQLRGFGGGDVIRGEVQVRTLLRDITDGETLSDEVIFERVERGNPAVTVHQNIDENAESEITVGLIENHTYDFVLRVRARKFGGGGRSDFQQGDRGVSFDYIELRPELDDNDGDGLYDVWEIEGIDEDCDGVPEVDLPNMGASSNVKDLYLELDWMTGREPTQAAVQSVINAFALAPPTAGGFSTPGQGVRLWVDTGDLIDPTASEDGAGPNSCSDGIDNMGNDGGDQADTDCLVGSPVFSNIPPGKGLGEGNGFAIGGIPTMDTDSDGDGRSDFEEVKLDPARGNFDQNRRRVFRYAISGVPGGPAATMGGQADGGNNFVLFGLGPGLLMHELGHTIGLNHGGPSDGEDDYDDDDDNCKPNYVSVMNYRFQGGILVAGGAPNGQDIDGDGVGDGFILDYSPPRFPSGRGFAPLAPIDETAWSEAVIQDVSDPSNLAAWASINQALVTGQLNATPDWNGDGNPNGLPPPAIDFNTGIWNQAAPEGDGVANSCSDGTDNNNDLLQDAADPLCLANPRCALPQNASLTLHTGADDWSNIKLDPMWYTELGEGDLPSWFDEPTDEQIEFARQSMQTTDLAVSQKLAEPDPVVAGQPLTYTMTVKNIGPNQSNKVVLIDKLPPELHFLGGNPGCAEIGDSTVECMLGGLGAGEIREVTIETRVSVDVSCTPDAQFAWITNTARVEPRDGYEVDPANDAASARSEVLCARYEYAAKYICGRQTDPEDPRLAPGAYRTTVNIHNPNDKDTHFFKKLALTYPPDVQRPGKVVPIAIDRLAYDEALKVDCREAEDLYGDAGYVEGYLVVQSPFSLDVDAVYTAEALGKGRQDGEKAEQPDKQAQEKDEPEKDRPTKHWKARPVSIDVEAVDERKRKTGPRPDLVILPALPEPSFDARFEFQLPEGVPGSLYCGESGPRGGPARTVEAIVRNIGLGDAGPSSLLIDFAGAEATAVTVEALGAGAQSEVSVDIPRDCYGPGACNFQLTVDSNQTVTEANEANNSASSLCLSPAG